MIDYIKQDDAFSELLLCSIYIDAFTVDPGRPRTKHFTYGDGVSHTGMPMNVKQESETHSSFFLVQLTP
jgi:hypothetical protein